MAFTQPKPTIAIDIAKYEALNERIKKLKSLQSGKRVKQVDVLIVGSGPIGAVFARTLIDHEGMKDPDNHEKPGFKVGNILMIDMGAQESLRIGDHKKNSVVVQKDISLFTNIIQGQLSPLSVAAPNAIKHPSNGFIFGNNNPQQNELENIKAGGATRVVGGMSTHWTCCTPRQHPHERSDLFDENEWKSLYDEGERLFDTKKVDFEKSVRHRLVKHVLEDAFQEDFRNGTTRRGQTKPRGVDTMPLAGNQDPDNESYIEWSCTATILGNLADPKSPEARFELMSQTQCDVLLLDTQSGTVQGAIIIDLVKRKEYLVLAKRYVICGGAVLTAGIVAKSVFESGLTLDGFCPALGKYLTDQTMSFCQVALKKEFIDRVRKDAGFLDKPNEHYIKDKVNQHIEKHKDDPVPFPFDDLDPQVYAPVSEVYPWHTQIGRDAFSYGELPPGVDPRLVVDLRFFGHVESREANRVTWDPTSSDAFGMPQPTFCFNLTEHDKSRAEEMKADMAHVATFLGDEFIPGATPRFMEIGSAIHICGIYSAGKKIDGEAPPTDRSVVSREGKVWNLDNLYLGGCGIISVSNASNPTLTAACHALAGAREIANDLERLYAKPCN